jgi:hypothetical protein
MLAPRSWDLGFEERMGKDGWLDGRVCRWRFVVAFLRIWGLDLGLGERVGGTEYAGAVFPSVSSWILCSR